MGDQHNKKSHLALITLIGLLAITLIVCLAWGISTLS